MHRAMLREALEAAPDVDRVLEAEDGLAGLRLLLAEPVDLVLCDLELPGIDGEQLLRAKRGQSTESDAPFLFVTACEDQGRRTSLLRQGACDVIAKPFDPQDLLARVGVHLKIQSLQRRLRQKNSELERLSMTDALTGMRTRRYLSEMLRLELMRAGRYRMPLSIWMADLDAFKQVNDEHGHGTGDEVLRAFSAAVQRTLRATDVGARWGGEEFVVLLPHTDRRGALAAAERVRSAFASEEFESPRGEKFRATVSIGVASVGEGMEDPESLLQAADEALYRAKHTGRNRVAAARPKRRVSPSG